MPPTALPSRISGTARMLRKPAGRRCRGYLILRIGEDVGNRAHAAAFNRAGDGSRAAGRPRVERAKHVDVLRMHVHERGQVDEFAVVRKHVRVTARGKARARI